MIWEDGSRSCFDFLKFFFRGLVLFEPRCQYFFYIYITEAWKIEQPGIEPSAGNIGRDYNGPKT